MITFCRLRPAHSVSERWASARRRQGTTVAEVSSAEASAGALAGGLLPLGRSAGIETAGWVVSPAEARVLQDRGEAGWRVTVIHEDSTEAVLAALVSTGAAFLRTRRSAVAEAARLTALPGVAATVSVFVDDVDQAVAAVGAGAGDLLLRDWDTERLGQLRQALAGDLVERTAFPIGISVDEARTRLVPETLAAYLGLVDGSGAVRPRTAWAPGKDEPAPFAAGRLSAEWADAAWSRGDSRAGLSEVGPALRLILERSLDGRPPARDDVELLLRSRGRDVEVVAAVADELRRRAVGESVSYVVNRNINYTNQCYFRCGFCAFSKGPRSLNLRGDPYLLEIHEVAFRAKEAWERGATEVCLQGGIHPQFTGAFYEEVVTATKTAAPGIHVHGFTPLEVWQGAETLGISVEQFLVRLRNAGLGTLPGTAAEILDDRIRAHLCPDKIKTAQWAYVMETAHRVGLRSTATIMFGHIDDPGSWANHFEVIRSIQRRTGGFTEFVPLPFVHMAAPIYLQGRARPGPTWDEVVLIHAVARLAFDGLIPNIQGSWVKLGLAGAAALLGAGCNDLGGTLMDENISRAAGADHGQVVEPADLERTIRSVGRTPVRRNTLYEALETIE
jgi:7,8-didemethyl-8-hydroxy-5-deazariboflavin synthase CofH subunit